MRMGNTCSSGKMVQTFIQPIIQRPPQVTFLEIEINKHPLWRVHLPDLMPCDFFLRKMVDIRTVDTYRMNLKKSPAVQYRQFSLDMNFSFQSFHQVYGRFESWRRLFPAPSLTCSKLCNRDLEHLLTVLFHEHDFQLVLSITHPHSLTP